MARPQLVCRAAICAMCTLQHINGHVGPFWKLGSCTMEVEYVLMKNGPRVHKQMDKTFKGHIMHTNSIQHHMNIAPNHSYRLGVYYLCTKHWSILSMQSVLKVSWVLFLITFPELFKCWIQTQNPHWNTCTQRKPKPSSPQLCLTSFHVQRACSSLWPEFEVMGKYSPVSDDKVSPYVSRLPSLIHDRPIRNTTGLWLAAAHKYANVPMMHRPRSCGRSGTQTWGAVACTAPTALPGGRQGPALVAQGSTTATSFVGW